MVPSGGFVWSFAILFSIFTILLVGAEIYLFFYKKQDRGFWSGSWVLLVILFVGGAARYGWDKVDQYQFNKVDNIVSRGFIGKDSLATIFPNIPSNGCLIDGSIESKQCSFLMGFSSSEQYMIDYVTTADKSFLRYGEWPFSRKMEFPPISFPNQ